ELDKTEFLPHRPDAFFTLRFPGRMKNGKAKELSHFLYEADCNTESTTRIKMKLRSHFHYIVKQQRTRSAPYTVQEIRAVLMETLDTSWTENLRLAAKENVVSPSPSPLFWFTSSSQY